MICITTIRGDSEVVDDTAVGVSSGVKESVVKGVALVLNSVAVVFVPSVVKPVEETVVGDTA